ncbi:MAG TPA: hypothetical protein VGU02_13095, partial [Gaiellaceae bacterium]|nr:hypothetical protein [Gaiellaceae bacterium]
MLPPGRLTMLAIAAPHGPARTQSVTLLVPLQRAGKIRIDVIGPRPSCLTAKTLIRHGRSGVNRLRLGPGQLHGLKAGRYLIRIPARAGSNKLQTTVTITHDRRIVPNRPRTAAPADVCESSALSQSGAATGLQTSAPAGPNRSAGSRPTQNSPAHGSSGRRHSGLLPTGIQRSLRHTTGQLMDAVEK